jgi:RNA polymerase sigma-32 factor
MSVNENQFDFSSGKPVVEMLSEEEESDLIETWMATRDQRLLVKLIKAFEPLVLKFTRRYRSYGIPKEELMAVGNLALVETANRFDPSKGFKFSTYSSRWIEGTMLIFIASNYFSFTLKSQKMKKVFFKLRREIHNAQKANKDLNLDEIMNQMVEKFECPKEQLEQIYAMIRQPNISLNEPVHRMSGEPGEEMTLGDALETEEPSPEEHLTKQSMDRFHQDLVYSTMQRVLTPRERTIIEGQMLMDSDNERTLQDLADEFDLSRERVRQIRNNAYEKLEKAIRGKLARADHRNLF